MNIQKKQLSLYYSSLWNTACFPNRFPKGPLGVATVIPCFLRRAWTSECLLIQSATIVGTNSDWVPSADCRDFFGPRRLWTSVVSYSEYNLLYLLAGGDERGGESFLIPNLLLTLLALSVLLWALLIGISKREKTDCLGTAEGTNGSSKEWTNRRIKECRIDGWMINYVSLHTCGSSIATGSFQESSTSTNRIITFSFFRR